MTYSCKQLSLFVLGLFIVTGFAHAQLEVGTVLNHTTYLQYEPIVARTQIRSRLGQPIVLNSSADGPKFYYEVRDDYGHVMTPLEATPLPNPVMMAAQSSITITNNMLMLYPMAKPGYYSVQPVIEWRGKAYRGEKSHVEVKNGREVTRTSGVVASDQSSRTYLIQHVNRNQQDHIALRIDDDDKNLCYGVFSLGRAIINTPPELAVDAQGNAHVLFQSAPATYIHATFSPFGTLIDQETFGRDFSNIHLQSSMNGGIEAVGRPVEQIGPRVINSIIQNR